MQPHAQTFPVLAFVGVVVQLGGALMLIGLFLTLRRFVLRRAYFTAWAAAWAAFAVAIAALVVRYILVPGITGTQLEEGDLGARGLYLVYQASKVVGFMLLRARHADLPRRAPPRAFARRVTFGSSPRSSAPRRRCSCIGA